MSSEPFQFFVNGEWIEFDDFDADLTLAQALRDRLSLTGTKIACGVGSCGSCTVVVSKLNVITGKFQHYTVNACITPIYWLHGCHVLTIEGLGEGSKVDPIQNAIALGHGTQCGFCTPGMVMSMYGCRINNEKPNINEIKTALAGNLCRCTGYRPILDAFQKCIGNCKNCAEPCMETDIEDTKHETKGCFDFPHVEGLRKIIPDKDKKIREVEQLLTEYHEETGGHKPKSFVGSNNTWLVPQSAEDLYLMIDKYPDAKLSGGYTSQDLQSMSIKSSSKVIDLTSLPELQCIELSETYLRLGAVLTISEMVHEIENALKNLSDEKTKILHCFLKMAKMYGSTQIRNSATLGGSLMIEKSHSDFQTLCKCFGVNNNYLFVPEESEWKDVILASVDIPLTNENDFAWYEKVSRRKDCDGAILNIAVRFKSEDIQEVLATFGGSAVSLFSIHFLTTVEDTNSPFGGKLLEMMLNEVDEKVEANMKSDSPFESNYVKTLAKSLLKKFNNLLTLELSPTVPPIKENTVFKSTQLFSIPSDGIPSSNDLIHKPVPHSSAFKHATGEARFCDDVPKFHNELEMAFVTSTRAHAKILRVNFKKALKMDKVYGYVWHKDLPKGKNLFGLVVKDEEIFASEKVSCFGQIIAGILANDRFTAKIAASLVEVEYEDITPVILTNEDAIKNNSFYEDYTLKLGHGDCEKVFNSCPNVLSGEVKVGGQEHFYMEPHGCIAIPTGEDREMEIISASQNPMAVQLQVSNVLEVPANRIVVKVKRVGGGFGGKESRCLMVALPVAIAANKFKRPVRCVLDRETDMLITGKRHPFLTRHKIAFNDQGRLEAMKMSIYVNGGNSVDVSMAPVERVLLNLDNAYNLENLDLEGFACKSNIPSNTVFRGTGAPQAALLIENIMDTIAATLEKDPAEVRKLQLYKEGDVTPYGQPLLNCTVQQCWDECIKMSQYYARRSEIKEFNEKNPNVKRGLAITPCNFGIGYTALHLNQGAALVHIYTDGSVLISHSGVEIGQGVHTKMIQVATRELGIPASKVRVLETATDKVPNSTPSSASVTSDMNGMAVLNACQELVKRLQPYWNENPDAVWEDLVSKAYMDRVSLSATGFHKVPEMGWEDAKARKGCPWNYFSTGAACSVVELDCLTGKFQILRTDIVMDVGKSLNPSIDVGQIEGAFIQGVGLFLLEELIFSSSGKLENNSPISYKIPSVNDSPLEFNVSLLSGVSNPKAIYSSKTVGEPPLLLATSVFFAIKDAIRSYRKSNGASGVFHMDSPATIEAILMACQG